MSTVFPHTSLWRVKVLQYFYDFLISPVRLSEPGGKSLFVTGEITRHLRPDVLYRVHIIYKTHQFCQMNLTKIST